MIFGRKVVLLIYFILLTDTKKHKRILLSVRKKPTFD